MLLERGYSKPHRLRRGKLASGSHRIARGGRMRKFWIVMVATICLGIGSAAAVRAQNVDWRTQKKQIQKQQKVEYNALKTQQRNRRRSWNRQSVSSAERA